MKAKTLVAPRQRRTPRHRLRQCRSGMYVTNTTTLIVTVSQVAKTRPGSNDTSTHLCHGRSRRSLTASTREVSRRSIMTSTEWLSMLVGALLASAGVIIMMFMTRAVASVRLHHPWANCRFKRRYRVTHSSIIRTTVETHLPPAALPVVRSRTPAGAGGCPTPAPAGAIHPGAARRMNRHVVTNPLDAGTSVAVPVMPEGSARHQGAEWHGKAAPDGPRRVRRCLAPERRSRSLRKVTSTMGNEATPPRVWAYALVGHDDRLLLIPGLEPGVCRRVRRTGRTRAVQCAVPAARDHGLRCGLLRGGRARHQ
jgi:hypothetical protein